MLNLEVFPGGDAEDGDYVVDLGASEVGNAGKVLKNFK